MKGYKGFDKGLVCRGKQYRENAVFKESKAEVCECGIHFCKNPWAVLDYYPLVGGMGEFSEYDAEISSTGYNTRICSSGERVRIVSSGNETRITSTNRKAVITCIGKDSCVSAKKGSWITLAEYNALRNPICVKTEFVDGEKIKEGTYYILKGGEFVEYEG